MLARLLAVLKKRLRQRTFPGADDGAGIDVVPREPAVLDLQNVLDVVRRGHDGVGVVFFEVMDFGDDAVRADVGGGERFGTIFHPKRRLKRPGKNKQHGVGLGDVRAEHHAGAFLPRGERQFRVQHLRAEINFHGRQFWLRMGGKQVVNGRRRRNVGGLLAARPERRSQQQHDESSRFHAASLRKAVALFNQTLPPAKVLVCRTTALARTPASH